MHTHCTVSWKSLIWFQGLRSSSQAFDLVPRPLVWFPGLWPGSQAFSLVPRIPVWFPGLRSSSQAFKVHTATHAKGLGTRLQKPYACTMLRKRVNTELQLSNTAFQASSCVSALKWHMFVNRKFFNCRSIQYHLIRELWWLVIAQWSMTNQVRGPPFNSQWLLVL